MEFIYSRKRPPVTVTVTVTVTEDRTVTVTEDRTVTVTEDRTVCNCNCNEHIDLRPL